MSPAAILPATEVEAAAREMMRILALLAAEPDATSSLLAEIDRALARAQAAGLQPAASADDPRRSPENGRPATGPTRP